MGLWRTRYWFLLKCRYVCVYLLTSNKKYLRTVLWFMSYWAFILPTILQGGKTQNKNWGKTFFPDIALLYKMDYVWNSISLCWVKLCSANLILLFLATYKTLVSVTILLFLYPSISVLHIILCMCPKFYALINLFRWIGN